MLRALGDLLFPHVCVGCHRPGTLLCPVCAAPDPVLRWAAGVPVLAATAYRGGVRQALLAYKERGRRDLTRPLAALLTGAVGELRPGGDAALVPVPSTRSAARARGGDHVARLVWQVALDSGLPCCAALRVARRVRDSAGLRADERAANVGGAFAALAPPAGTAAVVVDDIVTSGATLTEAVTALRSAGWPVLGAAVVAAVPRRRTDRALSETGESGVSSSGTTGPTGLAWG